jgi:DNA-binding transcriptional LysR family regulator
MRLSSKPFERAGSNPHYADDVNSLIRLAATGRFLAVVPAVNLTFPARYASMKVLPVELSTSHRQIGLVTLKKRTPSQLAQLFIEHSRNIAKSLAKQK